MPLNLIKNYPALLDIGYMSERQRKMSLSKVFNRDFLENGNFKFRLKTIRPIKKDGQVPLEILFHHLTTVGEVDDKNKKTGRRVFELDRSVRIHWVRFLIEEQKTTDIEVFSYEDRKNRATVVRTYIYDKSEEYIIILEPQRSGTDYYLLTAYHLNTKKGKRQIKQKLKNKIETIH